MTINFQDPRLQRQKQKLAALGPESRAILNTAAATSEFAGNEAMKELKLMNIGNVLKGKRQALDIDRRDFRNTQTRRRIQMDDAIAAHQLANRQYRFDKDQGRKAMILNVLGLIPRSYMGYQAYKQSGQTAEDLIELASRVRGG
jgi:hypothetical protein